MLFSSNEFLFVFLPLAWLAWRVAAMAGDNAAVSMLIAASLFFYGYEHLIHLPLMLFASLVGFAFLAIPQLCRSRSAFLLAIATLLGMLGYFKYAGFIATTLSDLGLQAFSGFLAPLLPIGISFFTLEVVSTVVDRWRAKSDERVPYSRYLLFVAFFPHLIAGPIIRFDQLSGQLVTQRMLASIDVERGLLLIGMGLLMKVGLADQLAPFVDRVWSDVSAASTAAAWLAVLAYGLQIYFDFNGYCVMAVGLGYLFGVKLPFNFESPYKATSLVEFWRRWNVTLSQFLRDYVYRPLGGRGSSDVQWTTNLMLTMLISGVWHGAGWNFVLWGILHGAGLIVAHRCAAFAKDWPAVVTAALTFAFVLLCWIPFRAESMPQAIEMIQRLVGNGGSVGLNPIHPDRTTLLLSMTGLAIVLFGPNARTISERYCSLGWQPIAAGGLVGLALLFQLFSGATYQFIYFRF